MKSSLKPWQQSLAQSITDVKDLCSRLNLDAESSEKILSQSHFPVRISPEFLKRMRPGDIEDPLLKQALPTQKELIKDPLYSLDPLEEKRFNPVPGLLHKYQSRVLLTVTGACAIHCRYCFRRNFPYEENTPGIEGWNQALDYIAQDPKIEEVIFSGGDPLVVKDAQLSKLAKKLQEIPHLKRLRIHTRLPIMIPSRIDEELLEWLGNSRLNPVVVLHCNHPNEIDEEVENAFDRLRTAKITLLNQSVLLKGINDDAETLIQLSKRLFENGVLPYYLHLLDPVDGAAHFDVSETRALELIRIMTEELSGYLVPKLVREFPGKASKTLIPLADS